MLALVTVHHISPSFPLSSGGPLGGLAVLSQQAAQKAGEQQCVCAYTVPA